jgi:hypothetical protein
MEQTVEFAATVYPRWAYLSALLLLLLTFAGGRIDLPGADWRQATLYVLRRLGIRVVVCALIAAPIYGLCPKYFQRMQISDRGILLDYRWPTRDVTLSGKELQGITVDERLKRVGKRGPYRTVYSLEIKTAREIFASRAVANLTRDHHQAIERLKLLAMENRRN